MKGFKIEPLAKIRGFKSGGIAGAYFGALVLDLISHIFS